MFLSLQYDLEELLTLKDLCCDLLRCCERSKNQDPALRLAKRLWAVGNGHK